MFYFIVILNVFVAAVAQMLLKKGATIKHESFIKEYLNVWVIGGYALMGLTLLVNIYAMSKGIQVKEVSIIESLSYLFIPVLAWIIFKEKITPRKAGAIGIILLGIFIFFQ